MAKKASKLDGLQRVDLPSRTAWRNWLMDHHTQTEAIWLVRYKKGHDKHVPWPEIVDEALCFGWIDSLPRKLDEDRSLLLISPRKPKSAWSEINRKNAEDLIAAGLMMPSGLKMVELAKKSGRWDALKSSDALEMPDDLGKAFAKSKSARSNFDAFPKSVKKAILEWINAAKKQETRASRIAETVDKAKDNIRANQWRQPKAIS
jgi:uncharacterized protein YdeI (YjbR/CyaY-like superfamily)